MIYILTLVLLVAFVLLCYQQTKIKQWEEKYWDESRLAFDTKQDLDDCQMLCVLLQEQLDDMQQPQASEEQPTEQGNFVKRHRVTKPTAETYRNVFDLDTNGIRILEHLTQVFCRDAFADTDRETCHRLGQQSVINFIVNNINRANDPEYKEAVND